MIVTVVVARLWLWAFDLDHTQIMQERIAADVRGAINGCQTALCVCVARAPSPVARARHARPLRSVGTRFHVHSPLALRPLVSPFPSRFPFPFPSPSPSPSPSSSSSPSSSPNLPLPPPPSPPRRYQVFWLALSVATMVVSDVQNFDVLVFISLACVLLACSIFTVWATKSSGGACCRERNIEMLLEQMVRRRAAPPLPSCLLSFLIPSLLLLAAAVAAAALRSPPHTVFGNTVCVVLYIACGAFDSHPPLSLFASFPRASGKRNWK